MQFETLNIIEPVLKALSEEGYSVPTPIQHRAVPVILEGKDMIGCAQTGTGKTAAFAIPILQKLYTTGHPGGKHFVRSLILSPTRELALQIEESFKAYGRHTGLKAVSVFGGVSQVNQVRSLVKGVDILVATPGRLLDLIGQGHVSLKHVEVFVLDEADRMLDMGFIHDIRKIVGKLPEKRQSLFFSATMPREIINLAGAIVKNPVRIDVAPPSSAAETVVQKVYFVDRKDKNLLLCDILMSEEVKTALVFTRTKFGADKVVHMLRKKNIFADSIHSNKSQGARQKALSAFKDGRLKILVATDIAARGIDVDDISHVINYEIPNIPETYVHRIGRTGRAGAGGKAISFCDIEEKAYMREIEKLISKKIEVVTGHPYALPEIPAAAVAASAKGVSDRLGRAPARRLFYSR
jgi:ATP-dependent RNA helicase RhlE